MNNEVSFVAYINVSTCECSCCQIKLILRQQARHALSTNRFRPKYYYYYLKYTSGSKNTKIGKTEQSNG